MCSATVILHVRNGEKERKKVELIDLSCLFCTSFNLKHMGGYKLVKDDVMLRTHSERFADSVHVLADVFPINKGCSRGGREHTRENRPVRERSKCLLLFGMLIKTHFFRC